MLFESSAHSGLLPYGKLWTVFCKITSVLHSFLFFSFSFFTLFAVRTLKKFLDSVPLLVMFQSFIAFLCDSGFHPLYCINSWFELWQGQFLFLPITVIDVVVGLHRQKCPGFVPRCFCKGIANNPVFQCHFLWIEPFQLNCISKLLDSLAVPEQVIIILM